MISRGELSMQLICWRALRPSLTEVIDFCRLIYGARETPLESRSHADQWNGVAGDAVEPRLSSSAEGKPYG